MSGSAADWQAVERVTSEVLEQLDWRALGDIYFHEEGESEWRQRIPQVAACGLELAKGMAQRLSRTGRSLWVGAGVAEVPLLLAETMALGREVVACNLLADECRILQAGVDAVVPKAGLQFRSVDAREMAEPAAFDHLGCISVFTDPERWPALSGVTYGRLPPVQLDLEQFEAERAQARELATSVFGSLQRPASITTTADEVSWFLEQAELGGCDIEAGEELYETAVVGDPVGFLQVTARA